MPIEHPVLALRVPVRDDHERFNQSDFPDGGRDLSRLAALANRVCHRAQRYQLVERDLKESAREGNWSRQLNWRVEHYHTPLSANAAQRVNFLVLLPVVLSAAEGPPASNAARV